MCEGFMQIFKSEHLGVNWPVEEEGSRKPVIFGLCILNCSDCHKYACINFNANRNQNSSA